MSDDQERGRRDRLWRVATQQRGYFTAATALAAGYSYQSQRFHTQRGNWIRVNSGIYRFREYLDLPSEDTDNFVRWNLWSHGTAVVSHLSALAVHDLGIANPAEIHLTVPSKFRKKDDQVVLHRDTLSTADIEQHEGYRVTTPLRAITESANSGADQDIINAAVSDLLGRGINSRRQLLHAAQKVGPRAELAIERALHPEGN